MLRDLGEVKSIRNSLSLTQGELASAAGVSQSLIAKIENGNAVPSYEKGKAILEALDTLIRNRGGSLCASDIHNTEVICIGPDDTVKKALQLMRDNAVSQIPVMEGGLVVGGLTEGCLLNRFEELDREGAVREVMGDPFPIIPASSTIELVRDLLFYYPSVLTTVDGNITGIITKADILVEILNKS